MSGTHLILDEAPVADAVEFEAAAAGSSLDDPLDATAPPTPPPTPAATITSAMTAAMMINRRLRRPQMRFSGSGAGSLPT